MKRPILPCLFFAIWSVQCSGSASNPTDQLEAELCSDGLWSGHETDFDCGGSVCGPCEARKACLIDSDCASGVCEHIKVCSAGATLTGVSPAQAAAGAVIKLTGTGFTPKDTVTIDGIPAQDVVVVSATEITAKVPRAKGAGPVDVDVIGLTGNKTTLAKSLTYQVTLGIGQPTVAMGSGMITKVLVADFNVIQDQHPDLALFGGNLAVLLGTGQGTFAAPLPSPVAPAPDAAVIDFNSDGQPDIATANSRLLRNNGLGFFGDSGLSLGSAGRAVAAGDFNGDGKPDLVFQEGSQQSVTVYLNNGTGGFTSRGGIPTTASGVPVKVVPQDVNDDLVRTSSPHQRSCHESHVRLPS